MSMKTVYVNHGLTVEIMDYVYTLVHKIAL